MRTTRYRLCSYRWCGCADRGFRTSVSGRKSRRCGGRFTVVRPESEPSAHDEPRGTSTSGIVYLGTLPSRRHKSDSRFSVILCNEKASADVVSYDVLSKLAARNLDT